MTDLHDVVVAADVYTMASEEAVEAVPWIYLICQTDGCPWWLGFDREATIADLASAAKQHEYEGEAWRRRREALIEGTEAEGDRP